MKGSVGLMLVEKRNKQFSDTFRKMRDPVAIAKFYLGMQKVFKKYLEDTRGEEGIKLLLWAYQKGFFFLDDAVKEMNSDRQRITSLLTKLEKRNLVIVQAGQRPHLWNVSAEGYLLIKNFSKESVSQMMEAVRTAKPVKKKVKSADPVKDMYTLIKKQIRKNKKEQNFKNQNT